MVGTSRDGLIAMLLAAKATDRLAGVLLNDIGPELAPGRLANIMSYLGIAPRARSFEEVVPACHPDGSSATHPRQRSDSTPPGRTAPLFKP